MNTGRRRSRGRRQQKLDQGFVGGGRGDRRHHDDGDVEVVVVMVMLNVVVADYIWSLKQTESQ